MRYFQRLFFFVAIYVTANSSAQNNILTLDNLNIQTGIDYHNANYLVFQGFKNYNTKQFNSQTWETIDYKFNALPETTNFPYEFFHVKNKNYLVASGCGEVYEFRNDSIIRIDHSFQQKNQFNASTFVYNDEIYFWGGYGLFTFKNILTKFDFKTKEWELVKYNSYDAVPKPRDKAISFLIKDDLYIISGFSEDNNSNKIDTKQLFDIWKLNLQSKIWKKIGDINNVKVLSAKPSLTEYSYQSDVGFYSDLERLLAFDFENNTVQFFEEKFVFQSSQNEKYNKSNNEIIYAIKNSDDAKSEVKIMVELFENYAGEPVSSEALIANSFSRASYYYIFFTSIFIASVVFLIKRKPNLKTQNCIYIKGDAFYYKSRKITNLLSEEDELLRFLYKNKKEFLQMNEIVDFISKDDTSNYNTLTKKKDIILNNLKQKLSFILTLDDDVIFIYRKNEDDKRIREIQLNPEYFADQ